METELELRHDGSEARLVYGDELVATAQRSEAQPETPPPPSYEDAVAAEAHVELDEYTKSHAFPTCFTCGPLRENGDGLRLFMGPSTPPDTLLCTWTPHESVCDPSGVVQEPIMWAALDCPSAFPWLNDEVEHGPIVLGRISAVVHRRATANDPVVVAGWKISREGRKLFSGSALFAPDGELLAASRSTWIELSPKQQLQFGAAARR